jgi:hypothetical protein
MWLDVVIAITAALTLVFEGQSPVRVDFTGQFEIKLGRCGY